MKPGHELVDLQETLYTSSNPTRRWLHCSRRDWIVDALQRHAPTSKGSPARALEVGPGSGIYLPVLCELFAEVAGVDIETAYLDNARPLLKKYPHLSLQVDDITHSKLPPRSFDLILCTEVIEHISDSKRALAGMRALLKPGGVLILSTPQRYSPLELAAKVAFLPGVIQVVRMIYGEAILDSGHINLMTETEVTEQLRHAGFTIETRYKTGMYLPLVAEFTRDTGLRLEQYLERKLRGGSFDWLLWTQYFVAKA
jgi:2-polyprenyl-3-methyl-5-hydroxy-6-metoxy-1,4-benzoquinol methylase